MGIDLEPYLEPVGRRPRRGRADPRAARPRRPALALRRAAGLLQGVPQRDPRPDAGRRDGCVLIGDGPDEPLLRAEADRLGVADRVDFLGNLPHYLDIVPYYLAADAFWFPSNARSEAFGLVQVEAMASGCPVINTAIPHSGVPWVSPHEETGLTVPVNDPDGPGRGRATPARRARPARPPGRRRPAARGRRVRPPGDGRAQPGDLPRRARRRPAPRAAGPGRAVVSR